MVGGAMVVIAVALFAWLIWTKPSEALAKVVALTD